MMRLTSSPAILPAAVVACRWSSLKYAGTVITALSTGSPSFASASVFSFCRIIALISGGLYCLPRTSTRTSPLGPALVRDARLLLVHFGLLAAHEALDREDRVLGIHHRLAFGDRSDQPLTALGEGDYGRRGAPTLCVSEN